MASITNYVKEHYFDEVSRAGTDYFIQNALSLGLLRNGVSGSIYVEFSEIKYVYGGLLWSAGSDQCGRPSYECGVRIFEYPV